MCLSVRGSAGTAGISWIRPRPSVLLSPQPPSLQSHLGGSGTSVYQSLADAGFLAVKIASFEGKWKPADLYDFTLLSTNIFECL